MNAFTRSLALIACVSLLSLQLTGLHRHVDTQGLYVGLHGTHLHHADPAGYDHSEHIDVSVVEQIGTADAKLIPLLLAFAVFLAALAWSIHLARPPPNRAEKNRHRTRWRPPLRAPPLCVSQL